MNFPLLFRMLTLSKEEVVNTFIAYQRKCNNRTEKARAALALEGYIEVDSDKLLLPDGREVYSAWGKKWVISEELHKKRLADAEEIARAAAAAKAMLNPETAETKSIAGTDGLSSMQCPRCSDTLQYSNVCGACAAGKAGYVHRYSCVNGCVDFVSKEKI